MAASENSVHAAPVSRRASRRARRKPAPRISVVGVIGEVLVTGGVLVFLFLVWQLWLNDAVLRAAQDGEAAALSESWSNSVEVPEALPDLVDPVVLSTPNDAEVFGVLRVPRFGAGYAAQDRKSTRLNSSH